MKMMECQLERLLEKERQLAYIQGTSAYKMFLEKKVDKFFRGENQI